jgi:hypothetical protein
MIYKKIAKIILKDTVSERRKEGEIIRNIEEMKNNIFYECEKGKEKQRV